ncbi:molybdopterin converting factor subunit 1 [Roseomonas sp. BN140053]|uniref:molybdopterin converting factor subunit 1 n=1 Tax=Roseomonas sp. BN140053 TaxID=3391898 RepID=UPI0039EA0FD3
MKILYFAWVRQKVGTSAEEVSPPPEVNTVGALMRWLGERSPGHADAFGQVRQVRAAVNQNFCGPEEPVAANDEVAFFPPVTGG